MKTLSVACMALAAVAAVSCGPREVNLRPTIPYVEEILNGSRIRERSVLEASALPQPSGDICISGSQQACYAYADFLSAYDGRDNVSGAHVPDALPDFAGERIACIADEEGFAARAMAGDTLELRRQAVMRMVCAMDTVVHITPYDTEGSGRKASAKLMVLADPCLSEYGMFDIDTLKISLGNKIPVVSPLGLMLDYVFGLHPGREMHIGIIYDPELAPEDVYSKQFSRAAAAKGVSGSTCIAFPAGGRDSLLHRLVRDYVSSGNVNPLDAVLVDAPSVAPDSIKTELADMVSLMNESSMTYGKMIAGDFRLVHGFDVVAEYCYDMLRRHNLFTHNIALPEVVLYRPVPDPGSRDGEIILIPELYVQN